MTAFELSACLVVLAALLSYLNYTILKLPTAIGVTALALAVSLLLVLTGLVIPGLAQQIRALVAPIDFQQAFLQGMLGFMLFAGSLHVDLGELAARKWPVAVLSTLGVITSTVVVGLLTWALLNALGTPARPILLPPVRGAHLAHRPDRGDGDPPNGRGSKGHGGHHCRRGPVQRRRRCGRVPRATGGRHRGSRVRPRPRGRPVLVGSGR